MARNRNALIGALLLLLAVLGFGYFAVGPVIFLFSVTFIGGFIIWLLTTFQADIDPHRFLTPYLVTVILFIGHVYEEYVAHVEVALGRILHINLTQPEFLTIAAFSAPIIWLAGAVLTLAGLRLGGFLVSVFLFGMMFGEPMHFAFPFMENGRFHYVAGMYSCVLPIAAGWYTFAVIRQNVTKARGSPGRRPDGSVNGG
jgi:hypothetical protein